MKFRNARRRFVSRLMKVLCLASVLLALVPVAFILFFVVSRGIGSLNYAFFTEIPKPVGETGGGMANAIVGTLILTSLGAVFAVPIGILSGVYIVESGGTKLASAARFAADTLNGVPSIVIGVFVYAIAVLPFKTFTAFAGGLALGGGSRRRAGIAAGVVRRTHTDDGFNSLSCDADTKGGICRA